MQTLSVAMNKQNILESESAWIKLKQHDQLNTSLASNSALSNFVEVDKITFPPTYRKNV